MITASTETDATVKQRIIERAWRDPAFQAALAADPKTALWQAFGLSIPDGTELTVIAETPRRMAIVIPPNPSAVAEKPITADETW